MSRKTLGLALVVVVVVALPAVLLLGRGDGGGPVAPDDYREGLALALSDARLDTNLPTDSEGLREASAEFREVVDALTGFVPPPEAAGMHARFVSGLDEYAGMLERYADAGPGGAAVFHQRIAEIGGVANHTWVLALNDLVAHGYVDYSAG